MQENIKIWTGETGGYKLLDCGDRKKLEEIEGVRIERDEPRAWWKPELQKEQWQGTETNLEKIIDIGLDGIKVKIKFKNTSKHIGIFPEQAGQWHWIREHILKYASHRTDGEKLNVLSLFGYTGVASLAAAGAGAKVTHVDASKQSVDWGRVNQKLSSLQDAPIRWIVDDVLKFVKKEIKQGKKYDVIIMDPPSYGKGPKGEVWKIEEEITNLLLACREILSDQPLFVIFNMYSTELSSLSVANLLNDMTKDLNGRIEAGELAIKQQDLDPSAQTGRLLPLSIFALWEKNPVL
jgi:23S rRNA (cytosine1962-C5)-methyltransferase